MNKDNEEKGVPDLMDSVVVVIALVFFFCMAILLFILCIYAILRRRAYTELPLPRSNRSWPRRLFSMREDRHLSPGLDVKILETLPIFVYTSQRFLLGGTDCSVCLQGFEDGEKIRILPDCNHSFHTECIDMWFHSHSNCPLCRTSVEARLDHVKLQEAIDISNGAENVVIDMNGFPSTRSSLAEIDIDLSTEICSFSSEEISSPSGSRFCRIPSFKRMLSGRSRDGRVFPSTQNEIEEFL